MGTIFDSDLFFCTLIHLEAYLDAAVPSWRQKVLALCGDVRPLPLEQMHNSLRQEQGKTHMNFNNTRWSLAS